MTAAQVQAFKRAVAATWNKTTREAIARALAHAASRSCGQGKKGHSK
jgi:hypothetical protein